MTWRNESNLHSWRIACYEAGESGRARVPLVPLATALEIAAFSRWGPRIQLEARECGAISIGARINDHPSFHGILMNVILMMREIHFVADPVIGESSLPHFSLSANDSPEFMRTCAFDQLNSPLYCHVQGGSQQQMHMLGHQDKRMQLIPALAAMPVERLQESPDVRFDNEQPPALPGREGHEISSGRRDESSRLQGETSAAVSRTSSLTLNWHEWNSCPSRLFSVRGFSFWENGRPESL